MAGTLTISTLSDGTNSTSATNCISGSAKAWVNFNGSGTPAIRASYNVSSITKGGGGDYYVNFTNAFADTNYCAVITAGNAGVAASGNCLVGWGGIYTTTSLRMGVSDNNTDSNSDGTLINVSFFR